MVLVILREAIFFVFFVFFAGFVVFAAAGNVEVIAGAIVTETILIEGIAVVIGVVKSGFIEHIIFGPVFASCRAGQISFFFPRDIIALTETQVVVVFQYIIAFFVGRRSSSIREFSEAERFDILLTGDVADLGEVHRLFVLLCHS